MLQQGSAYYATIRNGILSSILIPRRALKLISGDLILLLSISD